MPVRAEKQHTLSGNRKALGQTLRLLDSEIAGAGARRWESSDRQSKRGAGASAARAGAGAPSERAQIYARQREGSGQ
jgi:hypothetical protein